MSHKDQIKHPTGKHSSGLSPAARKAMEGSTLEVHDFKPARKDKIKKMAKKVKPGTEAHIKKWIKMREKKYPGQAAFD